jgi:dTDP-4-dehydrorhamnose 3,5-epimerase
MIQADQLSTAAGVPLQGPLLLTPRVFGDARGFFYESWNQQVFAAALAEHGQVAEPFVQDNHSRSRQGVLRGLHWQLPPHPQGKLVRCVVGTILDVAVDLRRSSATFGQWVGARLSADNHQQLWIPAGFAHGFVTLSDQAEVLYKTTDVWNRESERALRWDDPAVAVAWPLAQPILSDKDGVAPLLAELPAEALFA